MEPERTGFEDARCNESLMRARSKRNMNAEAAEAAERDVEELPFYSLSTSAFSAASAFIFILTGQR